MMKRTLAVLIVSSLASGCGQSPQAAPPAAAPAAEPLPEKAAPPKAEPEPAPTVAESAPPKPVAEPVAEPCDPGWVCARISLDGKNKVEKRPTKLLGDPKVEQTWSKTTDGRAPMPLEMPGRSFEVTLKRTTQTSAQIVVKTGKGPDVVIDKHEGDDFSYIGIISAEVDGALALDIRYMK